MTHWKAKGLLLTALVCVIGQLAWVASRVPFRVKTLDDNYLIFFWHIPSAMNLMLFYLLALVFGIRYLRREDPKDDARCQTAVEVGLLANTITMTTGSIWAKAAWGHWWVWNDPRLVSVSVMWLTYIGYVVLRQAIDSPENRSRFGAVYAIIAFINVPLVYFAIRIFGMKSHPQKLDTTPEILVAWWGGVFSFMLLYFSIWWLGSQIGEGRYRLERHRVRLEEVG